MDGSNAADSSRAAASSLPDLEYSVAVVSILSLCWESLRGSRELAVLVKGRVVREIGVGWERSVRGVREARVRVMFERWRRRRKGVGDIFGFGLIDR